MAGPAVRPEQEWRSFRHMAHGPEAVMRRNRIQLRLKDALIAQLGYDCDNACRARAMYRQTPAMYRQTQRSRLAAALIRSAGHARRVRQIAGPCMSGLLCSAQLSSAQHTMVAQLTIADELGSA
jgi:hypothetical protein